MTDSKVTFVLNHPAAAEYAQLIEGRFPEIRTVAAPDVETLQKHIGEADALLALKFPVDLVDRATKLRWFQSTGAGVDSLIPIRDKVKHIAVTNARGAHGDTITDYVMGGVTMLHWDFRRFLREQADKQWNPRMIPSLADMTLGVVGLGSIGSTIARRAKSAGMTVVGSKRDTSVPVDVVDRLFDASELADMLPLCDFVVLAVPATPDTIASIGAAELAQMKPGAYLVNIARGEIVVESDLIKALQTDTIAGALLDVFENEPLPAESPLWDMPNVIATPHVAGSPADYISRVFSIMSDNIEHFLKGEPLRNVIDLKRGY